MGFFRWRLHGVADHSFGTRNWLARFIPNEEMRHGLESRGRQLDDVIDGKRDQLECKIQERQVEGRSQTRDR